MVLLITKYNLSPKWVQLFIFLVFYFILIKLHYYDISSHISNCMGTEDKEAITISAEAKPAILPATPEKLIAPPADTTPSSAKGPLKYVKDARAVNVVRNEEYNNEIYRAYRTNEFDAIESIADAISNVDRKVLPAPIYKANTLNAFIFEAKEQKTNAAAATALRETVSGLEANLKAQKDLYDNLDDDFRIFKSQHTDGFCVPSDQFKEKEHEVSSLTQEVSALKETNTSLIEIKNKQEEDILALKRDQEILQKYKEYVLKTPTPRCLFSCNGGSVSSFIPTSFEDFKDQYLGKLEKDSPRTEATPESPEETKMSELRHLATNQTQDFRAGHNINVGGNLYMAPGSSISAGGEISDVGSKATTTSKQDAGNRNTKGSIIGQLTSVFSKP